MNQRKAQSARKLYFLLKIRWTNSMVQKYNKKYNNSPEILSPSGGGWSSSRKNGIIIRSWTLPISYGAVATSYYLLFHQLRNMFVFATKFAFCWLILLNYCFIAKFEMFYQNGGIKLTISVAFLLNDMRFWVKFCGSEALSKSIIFCHMRSGNGFFHANYRKIQRNRIANHQRQTHSWKDHDGKACSVAEFEAFSASHSFCFHFL